LDGDTAKLPENVASLLLREFGVAAVPEVIQAQKGPTDARGNYLKALTRYAGISMPWRRPIRNLPAGFSRDALKNHGVEPNRALIKDGNFRFQIWS
jgi:hypothetical protein